MYISTVQDNGEYDGRIYAYNISDITDPIITVISNFSAPLFRPVSGPLEVVDEYICVGCYGEDGVTVLKFKD